MIEEAYVALVPSPILRTRIHKLTSIAKFTLRSAETRAQAEQICIDLVNQASDSNLYARDLITSAALHGRQVEAYQILLRQPEVVDHLRKAAFQNESNFRMTTEKLAAIRGLSIASPSDAYMAALAILRDWNSHDRKFIPYELMDLDLERAQVDLVAYVAKESSVVTNTAIARAFATFRQCDTVLPLLDDERASVRRSAAFIVGFGLYSRDVVSKLQSMLSDTDADVYKACVEAIRQLEHAKVASDLVDSYLAETNPARKWILLDAILSIGDPGTEQHGVPRWAEPLLAEVPPLVIDMIVSRFEKRQDESQTELERQDAHRRA